MKFNCGKILNDLSVLVIIFFGSVSVVSSDADILLGPHHRNFQDPGSGSQQIVYHKDVPDRIWEEVVEAAFASPMEWIQLRRALDKATGVVNTSKWKHPTLHLNPIQSYQSTHPGIEFTYHKVYQETIGRIPRNKLPTTAIAAMSVSSSSNETSSEESFLNKNKSNNHSKSPLKTTHKEITSELKNSSPLKGRTILEQEFLQTLQSVLRYGNLEAGGTNPTHVHYGPRMQQSTFRDGNVYKKMEFHNAAGQQIEPLHLVPKNHLKFQQPEEVSEQTEERKYGESVEHHYRQRSGRHRKRYLDT